MKDKDIIICRCEEITKGEIIQAIRDGATTVDGIKRMTRAGKGLCQGRTCRPLVEAILMAELGHLPPAEEYPSTRPPVRPMPLSALLAGRRTHEAAQRVCYHRRRGAGRQPGLPAQPPRQGSPAAGTE